MRPPLPTSERGSVAIIAAITLPILIGFAGLALDGGRLYVHKTELQNAADACALAAARDLTPCGAGDPSCLAKAENSGLTVAQRNRFDFQGMAIGASQLTAADIKFSPTFDNPFSAGTAFKTRNGGADPTSRYAYCRPHQGGILLWFMEVLGFSTQSVDAYAVATLSPAQENCAIPLGVCMPSGSVASNPFALLHQGDWLSSKLDNSETGNFDWASFPNTGNGASAIADQLAGTGICNLPTLPIQVGKPGNMTSLNKGWNTRFGLYQGSYNVTSNAPDFTGYAYTPLSWSTMHDAYGGTAGSATNFKTARAQNLAYQGDAATGLSMSNGYQGITSAQHTQYGADRRLVIAPLVDCDAWRNNVSHQTTVLGYACVLMLHPMDGSGGNVYLEFRDDASSATSACATAGAVGGPGSSGPLVPTLVQ
ncbi:Tad domain-containing protein [Duganella sp. LX20W]|uniref:Tad domain-containing protein n=1 Tax=Rugamonas brunnea TaxID=2758569 RepID=A0A7W2IE40_9BURK|nr:Tad domain-containing protein [Rugamonas brunnea]MBA5639930.1 Tad domain-containing protein [Rugamonas brunnea]